MRVLFHGVQMNVGYIEEGLIPKFAGCESEGVAWFKTCGLWQDDKSYIPKPRRYNFL